MTFKSNKILVPIDFSEQSLIALSQSHNLAKLNQAKIVILHVIEGYKPIFKMFGETHDMELFESKIQERLDKLVEETTKSTGLTVASMLIHGKPHQKIIEAAKEINASMIVIGKKGNDSLTDKFLGSNIQKIIRSSPCPIITIGGKSHREGCETIILPLDLTKDTTHKVNHAISLAKYYKAKIKVVAGLTTTEKYVIEKLTNQLLLVKVKFKDHSVDATFEFVKVIKSEDSLAQGLLAYANKFKGDLILIMTQQEKEFSEFFIGSSAQEIIKKSEIPVMSIIPQK